MHGYTFKNSNLQVPKISGRAIASLDLSKSQLAAYAAMVVLGERELDDLVRRQICAVFGVSLNYLNKAIALSSGHSQGGERGPGDAPRHSGRSD